MLWGGWRGPGILVAVINRRSALCRPWQRKPVTERANARRHTRMGSGCRARQLGCGRCRIEFAVALLDPPRADMALHRDADMVGAIAGTCRVKFLSGFASGEGENTLAQARALRAGLRSRRFAFACFWRPP